MLHTESVAPHILELIKSLQGRNYLSGFHLVSGTAPTLFGINMLSLPDLVAMKLNAISTSGQCSKDFIDTYYLLEKYDLKSMLSFYKNKYDQQNETFLLKSLIYFEDVDLSDWPVLVKNPRLKWTEVKKKLENAILNHVHQSE